jgi:UDP-glucose 4-epimerase
METLDGKSIAVTGGAGFIGSHLCDLISQQNPRKLIVIDNFSLGKKRNIQRLLHSDQSKVYAMDATDFSRMTSLFQLEKIDVVFNLAVIPLPMSLELPKETFDTNVLISTVVSELLRKKYYKTLIHCSSSEAYGSAVKIPMDENHPERPITPYAASKMASDHVVMSYSKTFNLDVSIARPFNTYGPRQNEASYAGVIPLTILKILRNEKPIIYGDGLQTRDYTYVTDIAHAIMKVYIYPSTRGQLINIASGKEITIRDLIAMIAKLTDYHGEILYLPPRPGDVMRHKADIGLAHKIIEYNPEIDFETGIQRTIEWYKSVNTNTSGGDEQPILI